jgi:benzoate-CoA ligase
MNTQHADLPQRFNFAHHILTLNQSRKNKLAFRDDHREMSYGELDLKIRKFAAGLLAHGVQPEQRILLVMHDSIDMPVAFLGALFAGVIPVPVNTLLPADNYAYMIKHSEAKIVVVSEALLATVKEALTLVNQTIPVVVTGQAASSTEISFSALLDADPLAIDEHADTHADQFAFWLYSSGSTGSPKGTLHLHSHVVQTAELYGRGVLGLQENDVVFSAAKLFFAYGLGNALSFPLAVGATTVLLSARPTPTEVFGLLEKHQPTVFYGVPTLFASLLADEDRPKAQALNLRVCTSAGEALPAEIGKKWQQEYGVDILDGIGSTEMLHIFLSNRPGRVRYGTTGEVVPGYALRLVNDDGQACAEGELGELQISGPSSAIMYWNNREKTKHTFAGEWTRSGDKYSRDADGYYTYGGRSDDMLKVGGIYVSPFEVEASLMTHPSVLEAAVIGVPDDEGLMKPKAYVVTKPGMALDEASLKAHVKSQLAPYKYPRWVEFVPELPNAMMFSCRRMYSQRASSSTNILLRLGIASNLNVSRLFTAGKRACRIRRSTTRRSRSISSSSISRSR